MSTQTSERVKSSLSPLILDILNKLYIDSRYPGEIGLLPYGKPTIEDAKEFFDFAKMIYDKIYNILKEED